MCQKNSRFPFFLQICSELHKRLIFTTLIHLCSSSSWITTCSSKPKWIWNIYITIFHISFLTSSSLQCHIHVYTVTHYPNSNTSTIAKKKRLFFPSGGFWAGGSASLSTHPKPKVQSCAAEIAQPKPTHPQPHYFMHFHLTLWMTSALLMNELLWHLATMKGMRTLENLFYFEFVCHTSFLGKFKIRKNTT